MDYLFVHFKDARLSLLAPVALLRATRKAILAISHTDEIVAFYHQQQVHHFITSEFVSMLIILLASH